MDHRPAAFGGFALDRVLTRSIVDNFDDQLEYRPQLDDRRVGDRAGRRGAIQSPAGRPALHRALFRPLFPDQRRRAPIPSRRARCGIGGCGSPTTTPTSSCTSRTATNSRPARRAAAHRRARRDPARLEGALAVPGRSVARDDRRADPASCARPCSGASSRSASACRCSPRCRLSTACGRCAACAARSPAIRSGKKTRIGEDFPAEIQPLTDEINQLLAHSEAQAEEARRHAGNLAHALKTPLTVITNAATAHAPDLADTVCREATDDAPPGRPPPRPRPRDRPPRLGAGAGARLGQRRSGRSARSTGSTRT